MKQIWFLLIFLFIGFYALAQKPNVMIIISDDARNNDFGFQGSKKFATPNIDRIANEGVRSPLKVMFLVQFAALLVLV